MTILATLLQISASVLASASPLSLPDRCSDLIGSCEYYSCVETERLSCGDTGYPIGYGVNYCEKLSALEFFPTQTSTNRLVFPADGNAWRDNVRTCLQEEMETYFRDTEKLSCEGLKAFAFNSHPRCYTEAQPISFCELSPQSVIKVGATIAPHDLLTTESLTQVRDTAAICSEQITTRLETEGNLLVRFQLQKYRLIWNAIANNPVLMSQRMQSSDPEFIEP